MNMQIPSGLQALMQASQILQQQAAPTAPGPQGPQPTVASQVQQAVAQQTQPSMQQVGEQAGIAGQLMAQRQQQAQNPQAVAQMAAEMLRQQGVGSLPSNMQFRGGGIIGYAGPTGSAVEDPEAGMSMSERADRQLEEKGSIDDPYYGFPPTIREALKADEAARREGRAAPESYPVPGPAGIENIPRPKTEQEAIAAERRIREERLRDMELLRQRREEQRRRVENALESAGQAQAVAGGQRALEDYYKPYPKRGEMRVTDSVVEPEKVAAPPAPPVVDKTKVPAGTPPPPPKDAGITAALPRPAPALTPAVAQAVPVPTYPTVAEPEESQKLRKGIADIGAELLKARKSQADLESEGIVALQRSEQERKRLLDSKRSRDSFNSLMALADSLYTRGNQYQAYKASMEARDEADRLSNLAHEEAVIKLKQARQAKEMGNIELERQLATDAYTKYNEALGKSQEAAGKQATFASSIFSTQSNAAEKAADRANQVNIELTRLETEAQRRKDVAEAKRLEGLKTNLQALITSIPRAQDQIASALKKLPEFKSVESLASRVGMGLELDAKQQAILDRFAIAKREAEKTNIEPINAQIRRIYKELGVEVPEVDTSNLGSNFMDKINAELEKRKGQK